MTVTESSEGDAKQQVQGAECRCTEGTVADASAPIQLRKNDGHSKVRKSRKRSNKPEWFSDIDDAEVSGYLNSKTEIHYKTLLWEAINKDYKKAKKPKRATETKKAFSAVRAAKTITPKKMELQKRSEKINYDALKLLDCELGEGSETTQIFNQDSYRSCQYSPQVNISHGMHQDDDGFGYRDSEIGNEYVDEHTDYSEMGNEYVDGHMDYEFFNF